jgi:hypothetical protein
MADVNPIQVQKQLGGVDYPASKQDLIEHVKKDGNNSSDVVEMLNRLPDKEYNTPIDVTKELGNLR